MEIDVNVFLAGCISDGLIHGDILFSETQRDLNSKVLPKFTKKSKSNRTYYLCFDYNKTPKKHVLATLTMLLKGFGIIFLKGRQYSFSRDFLGQNEKVVVYAYGNADTVFHFFISHSKSGVNTVEYLSKNHKKVIFENL